MQLNELIIIYIKKLKKAGIKFPLNEIRFIVEDQLNFSLLDQITNKKLLLNLTEEKKLISAFNRRINREPIERILNKKAFRNLELSLNEYTFIPRKETELLVDIILNLKINPKNILELGTGSGAISISLMKELKKSNAIATDINMQSLNMAKKNAIKYKVAEQISFVCCNWLDVFVNSDFDLIIANPPYVESGVISSLDPEVKFHDPVLALDGGNDGLVAYRTILSSLGKLLNENTIIIFEVGFNQAVKVSNLMKEAHIMTTKVYEDYSKNFRFVLGTNQYQSY